MNFIDSIEALKKLSNEEIIEFLESTTFRGMLSKKVRSKKNPDYYCGSIDRIIMALFEKPIIYNQCITNTTIQKYFDPIPYITNNQHYKK